MAATIYLDPDDEITAAVARLRTLKEREAVLVLGPASRIGTSRINFKLLAREALQQRVSVVAVSADPSVRALAISAGLPAYGTVAAADDALTEFRRQDEQLARRAGRLSTESQPPGRLPADPLATAVLGTPPSRSARGSAAPAPAARGEGLATLPAAREATTRPADEAARAERHGRRPRRRWAIAPLLSVAALALLAAAILYAGYLYLPTASITLTPHVAQVGPLEFRVSADPSVAVADPAAGIVPAERIEIPLSVSATFPATGTQITRLPASGRVRFRSENTLFDVPIPAGTVLSTRSGIEFETTVAVVVPMASFATGPTRVDAPVQARMPGPRGNVGAKSITELPADLAAARISVRNPRPTSGGAREEQPIISQADYDEGVAKLTELLAAQLEARLDDPAVAPRGLTLFAASVRTAEPVATPPGVELVETSAQSFNLTLSSTATALAVNEALVDQLALERLRSSIAADQTLVDARVVSRSSGLVSGSTISYRATVSGQAYTEPDREALLNEIRGKPLAEARAILERHGSAEISVWPEVVDRLPDQAARINLAIVAPRESQ